jgi:uncharacterized surface protein with fasciclin (FAS1) repeats
VVLGIITLVLTVVVVFLGMNYSDLKSDYSSIKDDKETLERDKKTLEDDKSKLKKEVEDLKTKLTPPSTVVDVNGMKIDTTKTISQTIQGTTELALLNTAITKAGLVETLNQAGPYTILMPTTEAFNTLPKGYTVPELTQDKNLATLKAVLSNHVIKGTITSANLKDGQTVATLSGKEYKVSIKDGKVYVGTAMVLAPDVMQSNGVIHIINEVLL